ncbi:MAG: hypothetical protein K6G03_04060 [Lachnospiraceae bacterium]|nr:hypothetical protein [Lachnospiraceae bacterium]
MGDYKDKKQKVEKAVRQNIDLKVSEIQRSKSISDIPGRMTTGPARNAARHSAVMDRLNRSMDLILEEYDNVEPGGEEHADLPLLNMPLQQDLNAKDQHPDINAGDVSAQHVNAHNLNAQPVNVQNDQIQHAQDDQAQQEIELSQTYIYNFTRNAAAVKNDSRLFGDSWRMDMVKKSIDKVTAIGETPIGKSTNVEALKAIALDAYNELVTYCNEYLGARKKGKKDKGTRYERVSALCESAKLNMKQIASLEDNTIFSFFIDQQTRKNLNDFLSHDQIIRPVGAENGNAALKRELTKIQEREHGKLSEYLDYFKLINSNRMVTVLSQYTKLQHEKMSATEAEFNSQKQALINSCQAVLEEAREISGRGAYLNSNKVRREYANKILKQLNWENKRLENITFATHAPNAMQHWDKVFEGDREIIVTPEMSLRKKGFVVDGEIEFPAKCYKLEKTIVDGHEETTGKLSDEYKGLESSKKSTGAKATYMMASLLGQSKLFAEVKDARIINPVKTRFGKTGTEMLKGSVQSGYTFNDSGITMSEALTMAKKLDYNLIYSKTAMEQISVIRLMDVICGQLNRDESSLRVEVNTGSREGENYLIITGVKAIKNEISFGTAKFDDININSEHSTLKPLLNNKTGKLDLRIYDTGFADKLIATDTDKLIEDFRKSDLLNAEQIDALKDRLTRVKQALEDDKKDEHSFRNSLEATKKLNKYYDPATTPEKKLSIESFIGREIEHLYSRENNSYYNPALFMNSGNTNELNSDFINASDKNKDVQKAPQKNAEANENAPVQAPQNYIEREKDKNDPWDADTFDSTLVDVDFANKKIDGNFNSVKARIEAVQKARKLAAEDLLVAKKIPEDSVHHKIMLMMNTYSTLSMTGQTASCAGKHFKDLDDVLKILNKDRLKPEELFKPDDQMSALLKSMSISDSLHYLENYVVHTSKKMIHDRLEELKLIPGGQKTSVQLFEEMRLKEYEKLFMDTDGRMIIPDRINAEENEFQILDADNKVVDQSRIRDEKDEVLFPHPPCIQDIGQGQLGDCYLIASMATLAEHKPDFFQKHMKDEGSTVCVCLYKSGRPFYVRVNKSTVLNSKGHTAYATGPLWVRMYEKAFMISGLYAKEKTGEQGEAFDRLTREGKRSYDSIRAGNSGIALYVMTGKNFETFGIDVDSTAATGKDRRVVTEDGTIEFDGNINAVISATLNKLTDAQNSGKMITAATRENFIQNVGKAVGGNESIERGIASSHTYTVLGLEKNANGISYVRIRNPWGGGRIQSVRNELTGNVSFKKDKHGFGSFLIDISSFVIYFESISITKKIKD